MHDDTHDPAWLTENPAAEWDLTKALNDDAEKKDAASIWDPELEEKLEQGWFEMGDQESWIETRPHSQRAWESPRKS